MKYIILFSLVAFYVAITVIERAQNDPFLYLQQQNEFPSEDAVSARFGVILAKILEQERVDRLGLIHIALKPPCDPEKAQTLSYPYFNKHHQDVSFRCHIGLPNSDEAGRFVVGMPIECVNTRLFDILYDLQQFLRRLGF